MALTDSASLIVVTVCLTAGAISVFVRSLGFGMPVSTALRVSFCKIVRLRASVPACTCGAIRSIALVKSSTHFRMPTFTLPWLSWS